MQEIKAQLAFDVEGLLDPKIFRAELESFVRKANEMLKPRWAVTSSTELFVLADYDGPLSARTAPSVIFPQKAHPPRVERVAHGGSGLEQFLYGTLIFALEDDEFKNLRKCKSCKRVFVAPHRNKRLCPACNCDAFYKPDTKFRMRQSRQRRDKEIKKKGIELIVKISTGKASLPYSEQFYEDFSRYAGEEFTDYTARVKRGADPGEVWDKLPRRIKEQLVLHASNS